MFKVWLIIRPTQGVGEGIMFLIRPSVSQSVSPVFLVSSTPLKPFNRISWNFVVVKDNFCNHVNVHIHRKFWFNFFLGVTPFLNLKIWTKWKILLKQLDEKYKCTKCSIYVHEHYTFCTCRIYEIIMLYFPRVNWHLWLIYRLNT